MKTPRMRASLWTSAVALAAASVAIPAQTAAGARAGASHHARAVTRVAVSRGDWEARGSGGAQGSFLVATVTQRAHHRVGKRVVAGETKRFVAVEDLVIEAPINCSNAPGAVAPVDVGVLANPVPLAPNGSFSTGKLGARGGMQVRGRLSHGRLAITYRHVTRALNKFDGAPEICDTRTVQLTAARGHRRAVTDGIWQGHTQNNEPVKFRVVADGRALQTGTVAGQTVPAFAIDPASAADDCPGETGAGGTDSSGDESGSGAGASFQITQSLFVSPNGSFDNSELRFGDSQAFSGGFTSAKRATGTFLNPQQGCNWTWGAALT